MLVDTVFLREFPSPAANGVHSTEVDTTGLPKRAEIDRKRVKVRFLRLQHAVSSGSSNSYGAPRQQLAPRDNIGHGRVPFYEGNARRVLLDVDGSASPKRLVRLEPR